MFPTPRKGNISIKKKEAAEKHSCTHINPVLPAHSCAAPEPLQGQSPNLSTGILSSQLQQQLPTPLGKDHTDRDLVNPASVTAWSFATDAAPSKGPSPFSYTSIPALIPLLFVLHISSTLWKLTCCNSNLDRGMDSKHSRKHLVEWNKLAPALITEMLEWVGFFCSNCWLLLKKQTIKEKSLIRINGTRLYSVNVNSTEV